MKKIILLVLIAMILAACGKSVPSETVDSLAANPERLKELRQQCKVDRSKFGDEFCNRVAEATNRRFLGGGKAKYTQPKDQPKF